MSTAVVRPLNLGDSSSLSLTMAGRKAPIQKEAEGKVDLKAVRVASSVELVMRTRFGADNGSVATFGDWVCRYRHTADGLPENPRSINHAPSRAAAVTAATFIALTVPVAERSLLTFQMYLPRYLRNVTQHLWMVTTDGTFVHHLTATVGGFHKEVCHHDKAAGGVKTRENEEPDVRLDTLDLSPPRPALEAATAAALPAVPSPLRSLIADYAVNYLEVVVETLGINQFTMLHISQ